LKIEEQLKVKKFISEAQKAEVNIMFTAAWLKTRLNNQLRQFGLTHEQFNVLRIIKGQHPEPVCVKDITERQIEPSSNTTRILDKLQHKHLVQRVHSPRDKREWFIELTPQGIELLETVINCINNQNNISAQLSHAETNLLNSFLDKIRTE
jgi:DNA-binding MarR family transcriptional regulator